jgi:3-oxo-4,17-pregnadiene-20-carboxyl-CoA hydratase alpha subunit
VLSSERYMPADWPLPQVNDFNRSFFTQDSLMLQKCAGCQAIQHPPGEFCYSCGVFDFEYVEADARGTISSYTIVHHPVHEMLVPLVPYNVIVVELDAYPHVQIVGNLVDATNDDARIGTAVVGVWTDPLNSDFQEPVRLLQWRLA